MIHKKTIRVQGKGSISQLPDMIEIGMEISDCKIEFNQAVSCCHERTEAIRQALASEGIPPSELKTNSFSIREKYDHRKDSSPFVGFIATHQTALIIPFDKTLMGKTIAAVTQSKGQPIIRMAFKISDSEDFSGRVLAAAVANATFKAETIASASSQRLGEILHIEHGYTDILISSSFYENEVTDYQVCKKLDWNVEPSEIETEDTVTITWELRS